MQTRYGASDIKDLPRLIKETEERTAAIRNNYQFEVTNTDLAIGKLTDRVNSYWGSNGNTGIFNEKSDGSLGGHAKTTEIFDKTKGPLTIIYDTDYNRVAFVKNGVKYPFDANIIDPSGNLNKDIATLKAIDPIANNASRKDFQSGAELYKRKADDMNDKLGALLNQFTKTQGETQPAGK